MKKQFFSVIALLCCATFVWAVKSVTAPADIPAYYANVNGKSGKSLYTTINTITNVGFSSLGYDGALTAYQKSDVYPTDPTHPDYDAEKAGKLWDMYGACAFTSGDECGNYKKECDCYNREHSIPKSWWGSGKNNMYSDIFHLVPTDGYVNNRRSNYAFGEVSSVTYSYNDCKLGSPKAVSTDKETILGTSATTSASPVFEPRDEYKGDFARGYLGMIAKYSNSSYSITSGAGSEIFEAFSSTTHYGLTKYGVVLLMKWHREDPVSQKEIDRNNGIQQTQGNRNPFIDYPYLAEYIWGEKAGETVDMSKLMPSTDADFIPGKSNGWRDGSTPVDPDKPIVKFGVTWSANGETLKVDSVQENKKIAELPATPVSCSEESSVFMGWTNAPIEGSVDNVPAVLYTKVADFPAVTADVTYYAVFAKETEGTSAPATYTYNAQSTDGWTNTATNKGSYWLLDSGKELTSPEIDLAGLSTIQANLRTYGGTQYDQFAIHAGSTLITTIEVTGGSTLKDYEWTNTKSLSGKSALTFTCSNAWSNAGVGFSSVTINATGKGIEYTRYITTCQESQEVDLVSAEGIAKKILVGGQIYILLNDQLFTITGQRVK